MAEPLTPRTESTRFLLLYGLAWGGGAVAFVPFLTILLPLRVASLAPRGMEVVWLAYIAFAGAIAASISNIAFGYLSDITRNRRAWIWGGMVLSSGLLLAISTADDLSALVVLVVLWQVALNMMLAPLAAWAGDRVPDSQKGLLGGLLAFGPGLGALSGALVTFPGMASPALRLGLVAIFVACCVMPVLVFGMRPAIGEQRQSTVDVGEQRIAYSGDIGPHAFTRMWVARLFVQIAEAALFAYLYFWFRSIDPSMDDSQTARVFSVVLVLSAPLALITGHFTDRMRWPFLPLAICAAISAMALIGMAVAPTLPLAIATYALFGLATSVFLALHSAQALRVLPRSDRRGRDLGLFNLTNTVPSLIMPWLTLALVPRFGFPALFLLFAILAALASVILWPRAAKSEAFA
ncbi:MFS transporter [Sphingomonas sp. SUN039]|uniref:MFS transporter n=1 Tax=Sphingomonas sp. SUN039 TaxID=2937787 RepID=UPI002164BAC8|nr:MFS transporter [Sphingomonas sp. SUN039]UVO53078.1 MFS transporter [Sphingomonas sp. SUN039]